MWIADGEKYALVGLEVKLEGAPPADQIAPDLWALTGGVSEGMLRSSLRYPGWYCLCVPVGILLH